MTTAIVGVDGNRHLLIMPLSWGVCGPENQAEHTFHLSTFREAIIDQDPNLDLFGIVAVGDRDKGMGAAAGIELGMMSRFNEIRHCSANIALAVKGCGLPVRMKFETAASMYTKQEAHAIMEGIRQEN